MRRHNGPTLLAMVWLLFTASLVGWWWAYGVKTAADERVYRMLLWEGAFLLFIVLIGGGALVFYTRSHQLRHERLKFFFSTFAHDLKTSITRLRLQAEVLEETQAPTPQLQKLLANIQRLDLQLENSLWMASLDDRMIFPEEFRLSELIRSLKTEFADLKIDLRKDAVVKADKRALQVVFRNILQNSIIHGEASAVIVDAEVVGSKTKVKVSDNGKGISSQHIQHLGQAPLSPKSSDKTNGIGLYLTRQLLLRMQGDYQFQTEPQFVNVIVLEGRSEEGKS